MAKYRICFSVAGEIGGEIIFEASAGVSYKDAAGSIDKDVFCRLVAGEPTIDSPTSSQFKRMAVQMGYEPVVYCKNCKHRDPEDKRCDCGCWHVPFTTNDNDFCRYGEWRTNANEPAGA